MQDKPRTCSKCQTHYARAEGNFQRSGTGYSSVCRPCRGLLDARQKEEKQAAAEEARREKAARRRKRQEAREQARAQKSKKCVMCRVDLPLTSQYFYVKNDSLDGYRNQCRECYKQARRT